MQNRIKPFVKWAGGKGSLLNQLNNYYPLELKNSPGSSAAGPQGYGGGSHRWSRGGVRCAWK